MTEDELSAARLELDRQKADLELRRFEFDKHRFSVENTFGRRYSGALISASVAFVGIVFSIAQFGISYVNNKAQAVEAAADRQRQYQINLANLFMENFEKIESDDEKDILAVRNILISSFPMQFANDFFAKMAFIASDEKMSKIWAEGVFLASAAPDLTGSDFKNLAEALAYFSQQRFQDILGLEDPARYEHVKRLVTAFFESGYASKAVLSAILANLVYETATFRYMEEVGNGSIYEGRRDLGNTEAGDGPRFKGRGYLQIVGRANYRKYGKAIGLDLEKEPQRAAEPDIAARIAVQFFNERLGQPDAATDLVRLRKLINGGTRGIEEVRKIYTALAPA
jgi:predicted chitinase